MENPEVKERLLQFIKTMGLSVAQFERRAGLSNGYIRNFRGSFGGNKFDMILEAFPRLNREWITAGMGDMLKPENYETNTDNDEDNSQNINTTPGDSSLATDTVDLIQAGPSTDREKDLMAQLKQSQSEVATLRGMLAESQKLSASLTEQISKLTEALINLQIKKK